MKKIAAVLLSILFLITSQAPLAAQAFLPRQVAQATRAAAARQTATASAAAAHSSPYILKAARNQTAPRAVFPELYTPQTPAARPPLTAAANTLENSVRRAAYQAVLPHPLSFEQILQRVRQGKTAFLPRAILALPPGPQREQLLRSEFVTAAAYGSANRDELEQARLFWRRDLAHHAEALNRLPGIDELPAEKLLPALNALKDIAALALLGTPQDVQALKSVWEQSRLTAFEPVTGALYARALLRLEDWQGLTDFFSQNSRQATLQKGITAYAAARGVTLPPVQPETSQQVLSQPAKQLLEPWGPVLASAADPGAGATLQWMIWSRQAQPEPLPTKASQVSAPQVRSSLTAPVLPQTAFTQPGELQLAPLPAAMAAPALPQALPLPGQSAQADVLPATAPLPVEAVAAPAVPAQKLRALIQRASLYVAAYVMGLEVATPVIANFGSSFGLSLTDNILVATATYFPYSVGAFLSNGIKKHIGRRNSMNLGLLMMGTGFLGGVTWGGLDGSFVPEANTMLHFYKTLACITLASTGGVFVHNSIGPIMTELNAGKSDLVRQKRSATTEFSRALGMASSFAFPFIATKLLQQDWSFTFAMPLPFVAAALAGTLLSKLPNTRPGLPKIPATFRETKPASGNLWQSIKNNEYIRLFKEDKTAGWLLGGLTIMNAVEVAINNGFLFLLPSLTADPSSQYLFGLAQFAAPFLLGRYLAKQFLQWFPNRSMTIASTLAAAGAGAALLPGVLQNVYALTAALFAAETGISTLFTLGFARTAKNPATQDRLTGLIVASAISCAVGPMLFTQLQQVLVNTGLMASPAATAAALIGLPAALTGLTIQFFRKVEKSGPVTGSAFNRFMAAIKRSLYHPKQRRQRS